MLHTYDDLVLEQKQMEDENSTLIALLMMFNLILIKYFTTLTLFA